MCVYYGSNKNHTAIDLAQYDVVITTYQTIVGEHHDEQGSKSGNKRLKVDRTLFEVKWKVSFPHHLFSFLLNPRQRIILDEGHTIRNPKTKVAKAACALQAERRWVLTGTPIVRAFLSLHNLL
jgi:SWI/SNF-related matrix-associated actin-dependent regulator of chromatin subfamily A3